MRRKEESGIAVIGMSCRFPGANTTDEFWNVISQGRVLFSGIPEERRTQFDFSPLKTPIGAFLENPYHFDNSLFKISREEAILMDPQQRIMLELAVEAMESAGIKEFKDRNTGVFLGANQRAYAENITTSLYKSLITERVRQLTSIHKLPDEIKDELFEELEKIERSVPLNPTGITGLISNMIASRISHEFNLTGPSLTTDTACSSSLIAVHQACESLLNNECNLAFAGGVNLNLTPSIFLMMEAAQVISKSGRCVPFSVDSDGIILGEGAGLVLLKRLKDAERDGDPVICVIKGSGVNNDGHSLGIMTPSWKGQLSLLESVYARSGYDRGKISLIEAHGTSTPIGDSIEITVLQRFFSNPNSHLSIGSVKSNIGHLLGASGIAGLIKTVLAIRNKKLPPSVYGKQVNPKWELEKSGFKIQDVPEDWQSDHIRAAGVSAFGFGGTNAHIIVEEPTQDARKIRTINRTPFSRNKFTYDIFPGFMNMDQALFSVKWHEVNPETSANTSDPDSWLIFAHTPQPGLSEKLAQPGRQCFTILFSDVYSRMNEETFTISNSEESHLRWFFESLDKARTFGIVYIPDQQEEVSAEKTITQLLFLKRLLHNAIRSLSEIAVWCITSGAYQVIPGEKIAPSQNALATAFSSALNENTGLQGGIIDLEKAVLAENAGLIDQLLRQNHNSPRIIREGRLYAPTLAPITLSGYNIPVIRESGVYLVIGGSSGVGQEIAVHLRNRYNCKIIITGTRPYENLPDKLKSLVCGDFVYFQVSVLEKDNLQACIDHIIHKFSQINGILFSAGLVNFGTFHSMGETDFEKTVAVKVRGINLLHDTIRDLKPDFVYLMSSVSGLSPAWATGMTGYAAANAYLDAFSQIRTSSPTRWVSVAWSIWEETGMSKSINTADAGSMIPISLPVALELFEKSLQSGQGNLVAMHHANARQFTQHWAVRKIKATGTYPVPALKKETSSSTNEIPGFKSVILKLISEATQVPAADIDMDESFSALGLDSISALDIVGELENEYKITLNPTLLYEYDSISRLCGYFAKINNQNPPESFQLLPTQKAFYSNQVIFPESPCNSQVKMKFYKRLDVTLLQKAWDMLSEKHESLRLTFNMTDQGPVQTVSVFEPVPVQYYKPGDNENTEEMIRYTEYSMVHKVYPLDQFPLYDLACIDIHPAATVILFNAHHIITDAWSMTLLLKELMETYAVLSSGRPLPEADFVPKFSDYVKEFYSKTTAQSQEVQEYWQNEFKGFKSYELPDRNQSLEQSGTETNVYRSVLDKNTTSALENRVKQGMVSLFQVLISAYYISLQKLTGQKDLAIRVANANRDHSFTGVRKLTGCLADSMPVRV